MSNSVINQIYHQHSQLQSSPNQSTISNPSQSNNSPLSVFSSNNSITPSAVITSSNSTISSLTNTNIHAASVLNKIGLHQNPLESPLSANGQNSNPSHNINPQNLLFNQSNQLRNENSAEQNVQIGLNNTANGNSNGLTSVSPTNHASLLSAAGLLYPTSTTGQTVDNQQKISPIATGGDAFSANAAAATNPAAFFDYSSYAAAAQVAAAQATCQMGIGAAGAGQVLHANSQQYANNSEMDFWKLQFFTREFWSIPSTKKR